MQADVLAGVPANEGDEPGRLVAADLHQPVVEAAPFSGVEQEGVPPRQVVAERLVPLPEMMLDPAGEAGRALGGGAGVADRVVGDQFPLRPGPG
jgi:hypothetical protein